MKFSEIAKQLEDYAEETKENINRLIDGKDDIETWELKEMVEAEIDDLVSDFLEWFGDEINKARAKKKR